VENNDIIYIKSNLSTDILGGIMRSKGNIYIVLGLLCEVYFIGTIIFGGRVTFAEFYLGLGVLLIALGLVKKRNKKEYILFKPGKIRRAIKICFFLGLASFVFIEGLIIQSAISKHKERSDYLVILGAGLRGEVPSMALYQRLYASLEYIEINPKVKIVVSGGQGPGESITEALAMERFLINHGVAKEQIIKEEEQFLFRLLSEAKVINVEGLLELDKTDDEAIKRSILKIRSSVDKIIFLKKSLLEAFSSEEKIK